jgi:hypothetical protein
MRSVFKQIAIPLGLIALLFAPVAARAADNNGKKSPFSGIPVSNADGSFTGTIDIIGFVQSAVDTANPIHAIGVVNGTLKQGGSVQQVANAVVETPVTNFTPASVTGFGGKDLMAPISPAQTAGACQILHLDLGPIHLDLLGLVVDLNAIHLNIEAQPGSGNLLGNLLCAVTNLLNNAGLGTALTNLVTSLTTLLNNLLAVA